MHPAMTRMLEFAQAARGALVRALRGWQDDLAWWARLLLDRRLPGPRPVAVGLPAAEVFRLTLHLPVASMPHLREAVRYRLLTESPLPIDNVVFAARMRTRPTAVKAGRDDACVDVVLCRRDRLMQRVAAHGASGALTIGFSEGGAEPFHFVLFSSRAGRFAVEGRGQRLLLGSLAVMLLLGLPAACTTARLVHRGVQGEIQALRHVDAGTVRRHEQLEHLARLAREIQEGQPAVDPVRLLDEVAAHLPETTWVERWLHEPGRLVLQLRGSDPSGSVTALARSPLLAQVTLVSVTAAAAGGAPSEFQVAALLPPGAAK